MSIPHFDFTAEHGLNPIPGADSPPLHTGDPHDDDARVIDSLVESHAQPPTPAEEPVTKVEPLVRPVPITRILSGTITIQKNDPPVQLVPASPLRKSMHINVISTTTTDTVRVADDSGKLQMISASYTIPVSVQGIELTGHTGPVWVANNDAAGPVTVTWFVIAEGLEK